MNVARTLPWAADWVARTRQRAFRTSPADRDPVILHHSRIYILPTRRGFMLMLTLTLLTPTVKRGRIPLGRLTLSSDFPLGLWRGWAYVHFPLEGIAYPKPEASAPPLPQGPGGPDAFAPARGGDADLAGIREYQRGDPPQRVAWKAVARGAGWFTKAFEGTGGGGPVTLDYAALPRKLSAEAKLSRLTAWVLAAERAARPFELRVPGAAHALG